MLVADHSGVEVRDGHGWRAHISLAVDLGVVSFVDRWVITAQPDAADRETGIPSSLGYFRFLQERQGAASAAKKDEPRRG